MNIYIVTFVSSVGNFMTLLDSISDIDATEPSEKCKFLLCFLDVFIRSNNTF